MNATIVGGALWQWDTGRSVTLDEDITWIDYQIGGLAGCFRVPVTSRAAKIPNAVLTRDGQLNMLLVKDNSDGHRTQVKQTVYVGKRSKPVDYVYTDEDYLTLDGIKTAAGNYAKATIASDVAAAAASASAASGSASAAAGSASAAAGSASAAAGSASAAAEKLAEVNTAGSTQVAAVGAEGARVLAAIPDDYTEMQQNVNRLKNEFVTTKASATNNTVLAYDTNGTEYSVYTDDEIDSRVLDTGKCSIQWYRGGYNTTTGKWSGNSLYSEDSNTTMMHPAPMQMLEGDVIPCPDGYTASIAVYKSWHNTDDFEFNSFIARRSTPYTVPAGKSGYWFMPVYKTANSDVICDGNYSFKSAAFELMRTITPMLSSASSYYSMAKRVNSLENKMETMAKALQSLTGGVLEKLDAVSAVQYSKKNITPNNATGFGMWLIRDSNTGSMAGIPDGSGHAILINIEQKSYYASLQFYIMVSGSNSGKMYMRTKNKETWSNVQWKEIGGATV